MQQMTAAAFEQVISDSMVLLDPDLELDEDEVRVSRETWLHTVTLVRDMYGSAEVADLPLPLPRIVACLDGSIDVYIRLSAEYKFLLNVETDPTGVTYDYASIAPGHEDEGLCTGNSAPCITLFLAWLRELPV